MTRIYPLIICGGNGTRLWPISRSQSPKQFQRVGDATSPTFFQMAIQRHSVPGYEMPWVISSIRHRATVTAQLAEIGRDARILLEPMGRNTGPAVLAAALTLIQSDPDGVLVVVPADHVIEGDINATILSMAPAAAAGYIVTFGIKPRYAETGFGYITDAGPVPGVKGLHKVGRFVEKAADPQGAPAGRKRHRLLGLGHQHVLGRDDHLGIPEVRPGHRAGRAPGRGPGAARPPTGWN
jgi:mannose-1-phosphate guanylyltransferase/mannose-6-phosphate isomerase